VRAGQRRPPFQSDRAPTNGAVGFHRANERGAALLVVLLVITLLMGMGAFAARSTRLSVATSGNERRMTQARYVAEYGLLVMQSKLSNGMGEAYIKAMGTVTDRCAGQVQTGVPPMTMVAPTCLKVPYSEVQAELFAQNFNVCDPVAGNVPGSLGLANTRCDFDVELTDKSPGMVPAGTSLSTSGTMGATTLRYWYVTASVTGWVRLLGVTAGDAISAESSTNQLLRARIIAGPYF